MIHSITPTADALAIIYLGFTVGMGIPYARKVRRMYVTTNYIYLCVCEEIINFGTKIASSLLL